LVHETRTEDVRSIDKLLRALEVFRRIDKNMPLQQVVLFLGLMREEGSTLTDVCKHFDLAQSTASRNLATLAGLDRRYPDMKPLVRLFENPRNRASKVIEPTQNGRDVLRSIIKVLE
jgi:DNA-binding MarR family transcriptional regulator